MGKNILKKALALTAVGVIALGAILPGTVVSAKKTDQKQEVDLDGTYHARMGVQTCNTLWVMQMNYYKGDANETLGTELENKLFCADPNDSSKLTSKEGTFNEVEISGNGVYTVTLENANFDGETDISQLHVATDIPENDKIKFTNVKVKVNGREFTTFDEAVMEDEAPYLEGGMVILAMNHWRASVVGYLKSHGCAENSSNGWTLLAGDGSDNISITFTVSGFNKDNPDAVEATPTPAATSDTSEAGTDLKDSSESVHVGVAPAAVIVVVVAVIVVVVIVVAVKAKKKK